MDECDSWEEKIPHIERQIGHRFQNRALIISAFTHRSVINEIAEYSESNQRLEFLGDALVGAIVAQYLFEHYPHCDEGALTRMRAQVIDRQSCCEYARNLQVGDYMLVGKGQKQPNRSLLADLFEAITGAVFLDGGYETTHCFVIKQCLSKIKSADASKDEVNFKSRLQTLAHQHFQTVPIYSSFIQTGPLHKSTFFASVYLSDRLMGSGLGKSKKQAEQKAAQKALEQL